MSKKSAGLLFFRESPRGVERESPRGVERESPRGVERESPRSVERESPPGVEVLLVHPGGPYWAKKDDGAWSIPKGEFQDDEEPLAAATREFQEEMGCPAVGDFLPLEPLKQPGGKLVFAWAVCSDFDLSAFDPSGLKSNRFSMEWPPGSGRQQSFPEVDKAEWFDIDDAKRKILKGQAPFLDQLLSRLRDRHAEQDPNSLRPGRPPR